MTSEVSVDYEPLPGYRLLEQVGIGGYGEVWRAEAPGGLVKAIKFVFGQQNEKRAISELHSLERIRGLRHPFLLSLERIEVVDGRLMIVTELADESVRDRFNDYRQQLLPGIPRDELLGYLRDAADALDFISARHALQHLDIKPENLLLVAGHVKIADFGLVKSVQQTAASLIGGMTPLYSAPEVFRGTPSRRSDQYSLAILYQEMLTGTVPFSGGNAAELTLQHLNDEPDLSPLPSADRYVVARALSKEPEHRYPTCLEFIEALRRAAEVKPGAIEDTNRSSFFPVPVRDTASPSGFQTEIFGDDDASLWGAQSEPLLIELPPGGPVEELPPIEVDASKFRPTPTLIVGIGGSAGRVISHLRRQLIDKYDDVLIPSLQVLLVDTDPKGLVEATRQGTVKFEGEETLSLPLHRPQHYRNQSEQLLKWLSRRWLYNIPRSMRTEGLRPLGRLAFVDHVRQTCQRIRMAISQAVNPESVATTAQATGQLFRSDAVRVYIVASISGGSGSGMALDMGYAVRMVLDKLGIANRRICGLMMHSTGRDPRHCELARVNAYSWLTEFHYLSQPQNAYPGDSSCGLPPDKPETPPFDDTYLVHLGDGLDDAALDAATQALADYLLLDTLTPAQSFFDACRQDPTTADQAGDAAETNLRSFGIYRRSAAPSSLQDEMAQLVCQRVLATWRSSNTQPYIRNSRGTADGGTSPSELESGTEPVVQGAVQLVRRLQLEPAGLAANARALLETKFGSDAATYLSNWLSDPVNATAADERACFAAMDRIFGGRATSRSGVVGPGILGQPLNDITKPLQEKLRSDIRRWAIGRIDDPLERLAGARQAVGWLEEHFHAVEAAVTQLGHSTAMKFRELSQTADKQIEPDEAETPQALMPLAERLSLYFRLRLDQLAYIATGEATRKILSDLKVLQDEFTAFGRDIELLASTLAEESPATLDMDAAYAADAPLAVRAIFSRMPELAAAVDQRLQDEFVRYQGGLLETVMLGGRPRVQLSEMLQEFAQREVQEALSNVDILLDALKDGEEGASGELPLQSGLALAMPQPLQFGGARRVLAVLPKAADAIIDTAKLSEALGTPVSRTTGYDNSFLLCVEAERLSFEHVAVDLVENRRDCTEFAERVHTRTDIRWTPLVVQPAAGEEAVANLAARPPLVDPLVQQTQMISFGST